MLHLHAENHISERRQSFACRNQREGPKDPLCAPLRPPRAGKSTVGAKTWQVTASQLLPTLLPPTSPSKARPSHPAHLYHSCSPTFLPGCCGLLPAPSGSPCSSSEAFPMGKGLWIDSDTLVTLTLPFTPSIFSRGSLQD